MSETPLLKRASSGLEEKEFYRLFEIQSSISWLDKDYENSLIELWNLADNDNQRDLLEFLISNFQVIDSNDFKKACKRIVDEIEEQWQFKPKNTIVVAISEDYEPDGSQLLIHALKDKFSDKWNIKNFINSLSGLETHIERRQNIILVDDFIGTGETICKKYKAVQEKLSQLELKNVEIRVVTIAAMEFAKEKLEQENISYFSTYWLKKGIDELFSNENKLLAIQNMEILEKKLKRRANGENLERYNFGYKRSESLYYLDGFNLPNNVFPIFWWPKLEGNVKRNTLFKRLL